MTTISTITEQDVLDFVGEASFKRGQEYLKDKSIFGTQRAGMILKARCEGSLYPKNYRVEVMLGHTGITTATCSCMRGFLTNTIGRGTNQ